METIEATVTHVGERYFITIEAGDAPISIPISEDKPNDVKSAFNKLIARAKDGEFRIELAQVEDDLFSLVAKEYITQLNREIQEVRREMEQYGLVKD